MNMELLELKVADIIIKDRIRENLGDLTTLEHSIHRLGLLYPVMVNQENILLSGARRLQACRNLGIETVPVLRVQSEVGGLQQLEIQCDENLCRKPLTAQELEKEIEQKKYFLQKSAHDEPTTLLSRFWHIGARIAGKRK